ncbi:Protein pelota [Hondaea fermentalgiana]|uniref:Protein pelota homolog n=1 Tax=Hondaea fermentalgiana TaxID=2315210 RepID=A0A2R5GUD7_9STRA|nr:Protein pelota [Hondaea fermentalgiana]|eukprot:GBG32273.1 Protein pelota [Hondaea fermentalgiana]
MRLIKKNVSAKDGEGSVVLCADDGEDMWHVYNLISNGDLVKATTFRKVVKEGTTAVSSQRVRLTLSIRVEGVDFDPEECSIRLSGRNQTETPHVKLNAYHTIALEPHRNFTIYKTRWDTIFLERLDTACNPVKQAQLAAIVMQPGLAHVCLITGHMTILRAKIERNIPKKRADGKIHRENVNKFFEMVLQALLREVDFSIVKSVVIASPGYVKDDFFKYMQAEASKRPDLKPLLQNKERFVLAHASSGFKHALDQVLADPKLQSQLLDSQAAKEVKVLNKFFKMLNDNSEMAFYSFPHVRAALEKGAIDSLLITDSLFRSSNIKQRRQYVDLVEAARDAGAKVYMFSALHTSGEQLTQLSGVAAILRFPLPELDDVELGLDPDAVEESEEDDPYAGIDDDDEDDEDGGQEISLSNDVADRAVQPGATLTHEDEDAREALKDMF